MKFFSRSLILKYFTISILTQMSFFSSFGSEEMKYHVDKVIIYGNAHIADDSVLYYLDLCNTIIVYIYYNHIIYYGMVCYSMVWYGMV